jgi:hypothetical protein
MSDPFKALVSVLEMRMSQHAGRAVDGVPAELGTLTATGLKLDNFKHEIQDYFVADWLVKLHLPAFTMYGTTTAGGLTSQRTRFDFEAVQIEDVRLNWKAGMQPGDRVLALPVNGGRDAVVLCRVVNG